MTLPLLPTTMVGSYPRPRWFHDQLVGRDVLEAFKGLDHLEAFRDATAAVIHDQERAGLDIVADGQMWFDDYSMGIGAFLWYWLERIHGFSPEKLKHPSAGKAKGTDVWSMEEIGGVGVVGPIERGPIRMAYLYRLAQDLTDHPVKACVGAGPVQLSTCAHFLDGPVENRYQLADRLSGIFRAEIDDLVAAGCAHIQLEDLGAWIPTLSGEKDYEWVAGIVNQTMGGLDVKTSWHFCLGNVWGNKMHGMTAGGYREIVPHYCDVDVDQFVLDFACREMEDADLLRQLPSDKGVAAGVIDVRSLEVESPEHVADRVRKLLKHIEPERVTLTTDCGMKQLPRPVARQKLRALVDGARLVRREIS